MKCLQAAYPLPCPKPDDRNTSVPEERSSVGSPRNRANVRLASPQCDQSLVPGIGDGDNSLSMRWVKLGAVLLAPLPNMYLKPFTF